MIRKVMFILRLAGQDLKGNLAIHSVAAAIISASFLTVGIFIIIAANLRALQGHWEEKIQVCVYLADDAVNDQDLRAKLDALPEVAGLEFIDQDRALSDFREMLGDDGELIEGLSDNPLPGSYTLTLKPESRDYEGVKALSEKIAAWPGIEDVDFGGSWIQGFSSAVRIAQAAVLLLGALIVVAVVFIISNTIRLTMFSRKEEIGIMKLVGASNLLIRLPFVIEGIVQGTAAAAVGAFLLWVLYRAGVQGLDFSGLLSGFRPVFISPSSLLAMVAGGALLGAAGSLSRVTDLLRV